MSREAARLTATKVEKARPGRDGNGLREPAPSLRTDRLRLSKAPAGAAEPPASCLSCGRARWWWQATCRRRASAVCGGVVFGYALVGGC